MATSKGKKTENQLQQSASAAAAQIQPTPLENKLETMSLGFLNDMDAGKDVRDTKMMNPYLNLYDAASNDQQNDRRSNGIIDLAGQGSPEHAAALNSYLKSKRQQGRRRTVRERLQRHQCPGYGTSRANAHRTGEQSEYGTRGTRAAGLHQLLEPPEIAEPVAAGFGHRRTAWGSGFSRRTLWRRRRRGER